MLCLVTNDRWDQENSVNRDQDKKPVTHDAAEVRKEAWVTPEMSDYQIDALTEGPGPFGAAEGGLYS